MRRRRCEVEDGVLDLSEMLLRVQKPGSSYHITFEGTPVAVIVSAATWEGLRKGELKFVEGDQ